MTFLGSGLGFAFSLGAVGPVWRATGTLDQPNSFARLQANPATLTSGRACRWIWTWPTVATLLLLLSVMMCRIGAVSPFTCGNPRYDQEPPTPVSALMHAGIVTPAAFSSIALLRCSD